MKRNINKQGKVYVLAYRPYILDTTYMINQIPNQWKNTIRFYLRYDIEHIDLSLTLNTLKATVEKGIYDAIIIDCIEQLQCEISQAMKYLKKLARYSGVDIIVLSSVKRRFDRCKYQYPKVWDILKAFSIVPYADIIITAAMSNDEYVYLKQIKGDKIIKNKKENKNYDFIRI